jgi:phosphoglycerate dehydrogenase-like enzyme
MSQHERLVIVFTQGSYYPDDLASVFPRLDEVAVLQRTDVLEPDELIRDLAEADISVARRGRFTAEVFQALPRLRAVVKWGVGVEDVDIPAATKAGVIVANSPGNSFAIAEAAMLLLLAVTKRLLEHTEAAQAGVHPPFDVRGYEVYGKTLGIIGLGRIGAHLAHIAQGFKMPVLAYDPHLDPERFTAAGAKSVDLPTLLRESDFVSINCVLTPETYHLIGERELALMKPTAYLVNTSRGPVVNEAALYRALVEGRLAGAGMDVFEEEPPKATNPLLALTNVVATPHSLGRAWESAGRTTELIQEAVLDILDGRLPRTALNPAVKPKGVKT